MGVTCLHESSQQLAIGRRPKIRLSLVAECTPACYEPVRVRVESPLTPPAFEPLTLMLKPGVTQQVVVEPRNLVPGKSGAVKVRVATVSALPGAWGARRDDPTDYNVAVEWVDRTLDVQPAIAVFRHPEDRRQVEIRPGGDHAVYVKADAPTGEMGYLPPPTNVPVTNEHPAIMTLTCTTEEPGRIGKAVVETSDGEWSARIPGFLLPPMPPKRKPAVVVAIDFGTSSTSVARRNLVSDGPIVPLGPAKRFPSFVFLPSAVSKGGWKFGDDAYNAYQQASSAGEMDFVFIRNLKTLLREEAAGASGTLLFDPEEVLEAFFRWLLERYIVPDLQHNCGDAGDVDFVFTVPVLDNGELRQAQEEATLSAARRAGFVNHGTLTTVLEPEAAVRELLRGEELRSLRIALMDSGAGTTDIVFCEAVPENGHFALKDICSVSARATKAFQQRKLWEEQFGGEALSKLLAVWRVRRLMQELAEHGESPLGARLEAARWFVGQLCALNGHLDPDSVEDVLGVIDPEEAYFPDTDEAWHNPRSRFYSDFLMFGLEEAKRAFVAGKKFADPTFEKWAFSKDDYDEASNLLAGFLRQALQSVDDGLVGQAFDVVAAVGGNGSNPDLRAAFLDSVGSYTREGSLRVVEASEPLLATVFGACRIYDDPAETYPYGLRIKMETDAGDTRPLLEVGAGETKRLVRRSRFLNATRGTFVVEVCLNGEWMPLGKPLQVTSHQANPIVVGTLGSHDVEVRVEPHGDGPSDPLARKTWKLP